MPFKFQDIEINITLNDLIGLRGRRALVTGAGGGLGGVIASTFAELGADLVLVDQEESRLIDLVATLEKRWNIDVGYQVCDLECQMQRSNLVANIRARYPLLNILVNNAAFLGQSDLLGWNVPFEEQSLETWRRALEVNLTAVFDLCQGCAPLLRVAKGASIINVGSIYGSYGPDWGLYEGTSMGNPAAYSSSKGGLIQLTRWLAKTVGPAIRVNSISPGGIFRGQPEVFVNRYCAQTPMGRMATEDDFRGAFTFLATDMSAYLTGQNLIVDGGWGV
jgi:NAD(P)-dependent dehydrogenase (short-subunit alcohol dehydrogenase family)